ncbi:hypothetical protein KSS87_022159 [Heliosperma pusillum]|nr:hypothetical protein KSS87_022159 [Heliosperma pusillum]
MTTPSPTTQHDSNLPEPTASPVNLSDINNNNNNNNIINNPTSTLDSTVVFQLHPSFNNPVRVIESPPFELSECGWGEFEIAISLYFHADVCEKKLDLFHQLKLYPKEDAGPQSTKRPVVMESYDEVVFPDPTETFLSRVQNHPAVIMPRLPLGVELPPAAPSDDPKYKRGHNKDHHLCHWYTNFSEADELLKLAAARQQVQAHIVKLRRQMSMVEGSSPAPDPTSTF